MPLARLWIALTRPDGIVTALAVAALARGRFASCHLIYERSPWWEHTAWDEYRPFFASVHPTAKVPPVRGLFDSARYVGALRARQQAFAALGIGAEDTILVLGSTTNLANALASAYPRVPKVLCMPSKFYADACRPASTPGFRHTTSGWLQYHLLERLAGVGQTLRLKRRGVSGDGARLERLKKNLEEVFQALVLFSNDGVDRPAQAGERVFTAPFPDLAELQAMLSGAAHPPAATRQVVFFGTPFLLVRNIDPRLYAATLNGCLDYLRQHYSPAYRLVYRPHPAETSERRLLRLRRFIPQDDLEVAELYLLKNSHRIEAVFSVASTVSRVAFNYGLNGHVFWRCFPFEPSAAAFFESLLGRVPAAFDIRSLDEAPVSYAGKLEPGWRKGSFANGVLAALAAARTALPPAEKGFARAEDSPV